MFEFFIAALVVAIAPGPDNLFVLAQSATHGTRAGICVICGLCTGIAVQTTLLIVGVSALIAASPVAFFVLQCCGAAYLLYLAYKSFQVRAGVVKLDERRDIRHSGLRPVVDVIPYGETRDERNVGLDERRETRSCSAPSPFWRERSRTSCSIAPRQTATSTGSAAACSCSSLSRCS